MAATALILFTQGANTDAAGKAVLGDYGDFSAVTVTNGDNTDVVSWVIYLLDAPPDSVTFAPASQPQILAQAVDNTPTVAFTPDVAGTYRVMLEVTDALGSIDRDIRCFAIPDERGFVRPPYQQNPEPLPTELPVIITLDPRPIKPDEQNYGTNVRGWAGNGTAGQLDAFFRRYGDLPFQVVAVTPFTATDLDPPLHLVDSNTIGAGATFNLPLTPRTGFVARIAVLGSPGDLVTIEAQGGGTVGDGAPLELRGGKGVSLVHQGSDNWAILTCVTKDVTLLSTVTYVDFGSLSASPDGTILNPFPTITAAVNAGSDGVIYLTAGDYSAETLNFTATPLELIGMAGAPVYGGWLPTITTDSFLSLTNIGASAGDIVSTDLVYLNNCDIEGSITGDTIYAQNCVLQDAVMAIAGATSKLIDCAFPNSTTITFTGSPGVLTVDSATYASMQSAGVTVVNGTVDTLGASLSGVLAAGNSTGLHDVVVEDGRSVFFVGGSTTPEASYLYNGGGFVYAYADNWNIRATDGGLSLYGNDEITFGTDGSGTNFRINTDGAWYVRSTPSLPRQVLRGVTDTSSPEWGYPVTVEYNGSTESDAYKLRFPQFGVSVDTGEAIIKQPVYEEFFGGTGGTVTSAASNANVGDLNWNVGDSGSGGEVSFAPSTQEMNGVYNVQANLGGVFSIYLGRHPATSGGVYIGNIDWFEWRGILNAPDISTVTEATTGDGRFGIGSSSTDVSFGAAGLFFESLPGTSANVRLVARLSGTETVVPTVIPADEVHDYRARRVSDGVWEFYVDGVSLATISDANVPPDATILGFMAHSISDVDFHNVQVDRFQVALA